MSCGKPLAFGQGWLTCGETEDGFTATCTECGGKFELRETPQLYTEETVLDFIKKQLDDPIILSLIGWLWALNAAFIFVWCAKFNGTRSDFVLGCISAGMALWSWYRSGSRSDK
jgi:hypothetical protein